VGVDSGNWFGGFEEEGAHRSRGFHGGTIRVAESGGGGVEAQLRAPARWSRGLTTSVQSLGRCRGGQIGTRVAVHSGSATTSKVGFGAMQGQWRGQRRKNGGRSTMVCSYYRCKRRWAVAAKVVGRSSGGG
jgi:hypothetical protein